ncbi:hypothetical protein SAMN02745244_01501 [Tessaracoccus bendigoensis DSM 12906]|uniref:Uncharacterized protein n=1 Tax=Tessaracoccus bendigoensis DSM 12906 TaxID=1123357 RepID=A0A1M6FPX1_9ACTN|nr:hypothetical protein [Tessaracoccus bendigoensis]SHI99629.1 hypothetical protein SAMN02745244_01501 [Tessaracoccus bendigoensis DSM 12906]
MTAVGGDVELVFDTGPLSLLKTEYRLPFENGGFEQWARAEGLV